MRWDKLMAAFLPVLVVVQACRPIFSEPLSTCFVRADNDFWNARNITAQTFQPPKCPVVLPNGFPNASEAYLVDFFGPSNEVSTFSRVDVIHITPTGINAGSTGFIFTAFESGLWKARAQSTYFAGIAGFSVKPVDSLVALVQLNDGQVARGVAELRYQPGTATLNAPWGTAGVEATLSVTNIADLPGPYTFEWFLDDVSMGSTGSQPSTTYTVSSPGWHHVDALVRGVNGLSILLSAEPFFNDGPGQCIVCGP